MAPQFFKIVFLVSQIALAIGIFYFVFLRKSSDSVTGFRIREADLERPGSGKLNRSGEDALANAKLTRDIPLRLGGISIHAPAHEILGVAAQASAEEISRAYREKMKQYHPDKVGRPGTREWNDAQKIAEAINRAKDELIKAAGRGRS